MVRSEIVIDDRILERISHFNYVGCEISYRNRHSSVGIATRLRAGRTDDWSSNPGGGLKFFSLTPRSDRLWGPPASHPVGTRGSFPGSKAAGA
jgi:hypothetical protein